MRELQLDYVGWESLLVEQRRGSRPEAVGCVYLARISDTTESCAESAVAQRSLAGTDRREHKAAAPRDCLDLAQDLNRLPRERHQVLDAHLHTRRRDPPLGGREVEFRPLGRAQLARAYENVGQ